MIRNALLLVLSLMCFVGGDAPVNAQITPDVKSSFGVYERGVLVGEIYRADLDVERYTEHWVLYPGYVYPSAANGVTVEIRGGLTEYRDLGDFFRRVPFGTGSRYVRTDCIDGTTLPGR